MAVDLTVPEWLQACVRVWSEVLGLSGWSIKLALSLSPGDDPAAEAHVDQYPNLNTCILTFSVEAEDTPYWHMVVVHELLHVAHARIDQLIEEAIIPQLDPSPASLASRVYHQQVEAYTHALGTALAKIGERERDEQTPEQSGGSLEADPVGVREVAVPDLRPETVAPVL